MIREDVAFEFMKILITRESNLNPQAVKFLAHLSVLLADALISEIDK